MAAQERAAAEGAADVACAVHLERHRDRHRLAGHRGAQGDVPADFEPPGEQILAGQQQDGEVGRGRERVFELGGGVLAASGGRGQEVARMLSRAVAGGDAGGHPASLDERLVQSRALQSAQDGGQHVERGLVVAGEDGRSLVEETIRACLEADEDELSRDDFKRAFASLTIGSGAAAVLLERAQPDDDHRFLGGAIRSATAFNSAAFFAASSCASGVTLVTLSVSSLASPILRYRLRTTSGCSSPMMS